MIVCSKTVQIILFPANLDDSVNMDDSIYMCGLINGIHVNNTTFGFSQFRDLLFFFRKNCSFYACMHR